MFIVTFLSLWQKLGVNVRGNSILAITRTSRYYRSTVPGKIERLLGLSKDIEGKWIFKGDKIFVRRQWLGAHTAGSQKEFRLLKKWKDSWWNIYVHQRLRHGRRFKCQVNTNGLKKSYVVRIRRGQIEEARFRRGIG